MDLQEINASYYRQRETLKDFKQGICIEKIFILEWENKTLNNLDAIKPVGGFA